MASTVNPSRSLLFLSRPSSSLGARVLNNSLSPTLSFTLKDVSRKSSTSSQAPILDIALTTTESSENGPFPLYNYNQIQADIAGVYKSLCLVSISEDIDLQGPSGVDVRVLILSPTLERTRIDQGPHVSLFSLARSHDKWQSIYVSEDDAGHQIANLFEQWAFDGVDQEVRVQMQYVPAKSSTLSSIRPSIKGSESLKDQQYRIVAVGGTFDHLHIGHKLLLTMTASLLEQSISDRSWKRLIVGITGDELLTKKKYAEYLESWTDRQYKVFQFLRDIIDFRDSKSDPTATQSQDRSSPEGRAIHYVVGKRIRIECVEIKDPFGPTIVDSEISALVLSGETRDGGKSINDKRREKGWAELKIFEVDVLDTEIPTEKDASEKAHVQQSFEGKISSTEIRRLESINNAADQQS